MATFVKTSDPASASFEIATPRADCRVGFPTAPAYVGRVLTVDEKSAICLIAMARDLLAAEHNAVAALLDYALTEIASDPNG